MGMKEAVDQLQQVFAEGVYNAGANFQMAEKNTTGEGGVRFMSANDSNWIKAQITSVSAELNKMEVVVSVNTDGFSGMRKSDIAKNIEKEYSS